ncbi:hypothetical protein QUA35_16730 [Microcoleus sp. N9_B2]|uniref:hypothetical protein n=1 Tax=unclassified Microcoleus TaxID=2642155 RepID=UPI002FD3EB85
MNDFRSERTRLQSKQVELTQSWVIWEFSAVIETKGFKFETVNLHDILKAELQAQQVPIDVFYTNAGWIIEGAGNTLKIDKDVRARVTANLRNSIYTNMQFIAGIDYFGDSNWADIQMMMIVQPEKPETIPDPPIRPQAANTQPLIPDAAFLVLALIAVGLFYSGNGGLQVLSIVGVMGALGIYMTSNSQVAEAKRKYDSQLAIYQEDNIERNRQIEKIKLEEEELKRNRLSRSFQWDDLRLLHTIMSRSVGKIIHNNMLQKGGTVKEFVHQTKNEEIIPESKKDILNEFQ